MLNLKIRPNKVTHHICMFNAYLYDQMKSINTLKILSFSTLCYSLFWFTIYRRFKLYRSNTIHGKFTKVMN